MTLKTTAAPPDTDATPVRIESKKPSGKPGHQVSLNGNVSPWLFLGPGLAITLLFVFYPFLRTIFNSFTNARPFDSGEFVGLANYATVFADPLFWVAFRNSSLYVVCVVPFMVALPLLLALLVQRTIPGIEVGS